MTIADSQLFCERCTGCGACRDICPKGAISMLQDAEGFYYPDIKQNLCVKCSKCVAVCPLGKDETEFTPHMVLTGRALSEDSLVLGSSGGIFPELAQKVYDMGGVVYGVAMDSIPPKATYCKNTEIPLERIFRSKYVEASDDVTFSQVKDDLQVGRTVVYCGTPCKIAGLLSFLGNDYANLITLDFMCHGKPSAKFLEDVIKDEESAVSDTCVDISFREKLYGWRRQNIIFYFKKCSPAIYESNHYYYYYYYLHNCSIRKSCFQCTYYSRHKSDLTLADYWSIPKEQDDDKGTSIIFVNTDKGKRIIDCIGSRLNITEIEKSSIINNLGIYAHTKRKGYYINRRNAFYRDYLKRGLEYVKGEGYRKQVSRDKVRQKVIDNLLKLRKLIR